MILIGYARVSTINQNEDRQIQELIKYGVEEKRIYIDKQSGKDFHRPSYMKMLKRLKKGDVLVVKSIDRLGRNYREIQEEWRIITHKRNADIVLFGHTHLPITEYDDELYLLNPGSLQYADGTYGIIDITDAGISVQIIKV